MGSGMRFNSLRSAQGLGPHGDLTNREQRLLTLLRQKGPISRAALIRMSGLSGPAIFRVTEDLAEKGYLFIGQSIASGRGQPSNEVRLNPDAAFALGISVMNDYAEAAIMDITSQIREVRTITVPGIGRASILNKARQMLDDWIGKGLRREALSGIGISIPGFFVGEGQKINPVLPLDDWALVELGPIIEDMFGAPAHIENNASAAAVGENLVGIGRKYDSFVYVNFNFGFGGGVILNGRLWRGIHGNAGELAAMLKAVDLFVPTLESLRLEFVKAGYAYLSVSEMLGALPQKSPVISAWMEKASFSVARLARMINAAFNVGALVIGGRLPTALAEPLCAQVNMYLQDMDSAARRNRKLPMLVAVPSQLSSQVSVIGAASLPLAAHVFRPINTTS